MQLSDSGLQMSFKNALPPNYLENELFSSLIQFGALAVINTFSVSKDLTDQKIPHNILLTQYKVQSKCTNIMSRYFISYIAGQFRAN